MKRAKRASRGVSLIEALVALGVLAFGMLGIAGLQASVRAGSDVSKQRAEAVRLAQEILEDRRAFSVINNGGDDTIRSYDGIVSTGAETIAGTNASFSRVLTVTAGVAGRTKALAAEVQWADRAGNNQVIRLFSSIAGSAPDLAGTLGAPPSGSPARQPQGRHPGIPPGATDLGDGTSRFSPPGGGTISWVFDNATGLITRLCASPDTCTPVNAQLLAGFIRFATGAGQPLPADAEVPPSTSLAGVEVAVDQTAPSTATIGCYQQTTVAYMAYYCAIPLGGAGDPWSGRARLAGVALAATIADAAGSVYRVCRYTKDRAHTPVGPNFTNADHPLDYDNVLGPLVAQNYLVIRAGSGTTAFDCPADDAATPFVNGNTWHHQPAS